MMSFIKSMQHRYTTKKYDPTRKIDPKKIEELKEILRMSPSSINSQPWKFTFVTDAKIKEEFARASNYNIEKVRNCDTLIVFSRINNIQLFENQIAEILPQGANDYYKRIIKPLTDEQILDWFSRQVYLALGVFLSACAEMKIDSTPMEGINLEQYRQILGASDYTPLFAVAIGYRDMEDFNQPDKKAKSRKTLHQVIDSI